MIFFTGGRTLIVLFAILTNARWDSADCEFVQDQSVGIIQNGEPEWFKSGSRSSGKSDFICVSTAGNATQALAEQELLMLLKAAIEEQIAVWQEESGEEFPQLTSHFIREKLIVGDHFVVLPYEDELTRAAATVQGDVPTPYYKGYAEVELTPKFRSWVVQWRRQPVLRDMLSLLGVITGSVIASIAILFGYLRLEQLTHSHYTKRLQLVGLAAFLVLGAVVYQLIRVL